MPIHKPKKPLDITQVPPSAANEAVLQKLRPLKDYRLAYINYKYPMLSMLYAVFAGGENTLYCDHTGDYVSAYFVDPHADEKTRHAQMAKAQAVGKVVTTPNGGLEAERQSQRELPPGQQGVVIASPHQWDGLLAILKAELEQVDPTPPLPAIPMW